MRRMKDSDIEWIGLIPVEWETIKVKWSSWLKGRIGWQGLTASEYIDDGPFLVTGTDFQDGVVNWDSCAHISEERFEEDDDIHIKEGDLLITKDGTVGKVAIAKNCPEKVSLNSGVLLIRNVGQYRYYDKYLYYVLLSDEFWRWYTLSQTGQSTIKHLYQAQFYEFEYTYPSYTEQQRIANFLDAECARIDAIIEQTRATVEEYKKLKQSIITQAVTKGIRPNRPMKDSGIEWIGEIPEDWDSIKFKYLFSIIGGNGFPDALQGHTEGDFPFCKVSDINGVEDYVNTAINWISRSVVEDNKFNVIPIGSIIMAKIGAALAKNHRKINNVECCIDNNTQALVPKRDDNTRYLFYLSKCIDMSWFDNGSTVPSINNTKLLNFFVPNVSKNEQTCIVNFLDIECARINSIVEKKTAFIEELLNYKKSVIFEYVTGKKEVL